MAGKKGTKITPKIYVVIGPTGAHLVESKTEAGAIGHVVGKAYKVRLASQRDVYEAAIAGVKVESAVPAEPEPEPAAAE